MQYADHYFDLRNLLLLFVHPPTCWISYPPVFLFVLVRFLVVVVMMFVGFCFHSFCYLWFRGLTLAYYIATPALLSTLASCACSPSTISPLCSP